MREIHSSQEYEKLKKASEMATHPKVSASIMFRKEAFWQGLDDPNLAFLRIIPERIEYMRRGDEDAKDVSAVLLTAMGGR